MNSRYLFDEDNHIHTLDGKPLMGVTSVLSVISKPFLIQWSANMATDYIAERIKPDVGYSETDLALILKEAKTAHRKKKEKAGDWGTEVHEAIENWIKGKGEPKFEGTQKQAFDNFKKWSEDNGVLFLESEKHLWSEKLWLGGICDLVIKMNGEKYIADIKTSSGIYDEAFFQMGAYDLMLEESGIKDVKGYLVINLKKDGTMATRLEVDMLQNREAFKYALGLYQIINSLK